MGDVIKVDFTRNPKSFEYSERRATETYSNYQSARDRYRQGNSWVLKLIAVITILATVFLLN